MKDWIRRWKWSYQVYNFFHKKALEHNLEAYKALGLQKHYFSSISSADFKHLGNQYLSIPTKEELMQVKLYTKATAAQQAHMLDYEKNGFMIIPRFVDSNVVDEINAAIQEGVKNRTLHYTNRTKIMFAFQQIPALKKVAEQDSLHELLDVLIQGESKLFQSINFTQGSEQHTHSDSFHMTTYPLGGLLGVWVALEDIGPDNGPLHYYPGSHRLPYYMNADYDNEGNSIFLGPKDYSAYEHFIEQKIQEQGLEKKIFTAKKGDLLIWHANLFHGGEPHHDKSKTRKSVVFHYFRKGCVCYHEITQRPALMQ